MPTRLAYSSIEDVKSGCCLRTLRLDPDTIFAIQEMCKSESYPPVFLPLSLHLQRWGLPTKILVTP